MRASVAASKTASPPGPSLPPVPTYTLVAPSNRTLSAFSPAGVTAVSSTVTASYARTVPSPPQARTIQP